MIVNKTTHFIQHLGLLSIWT